MKKSLGILFLALTLGCSNPSGYKIQVVLDGAKGKIFLEQREKGNFVPKDTAEFKNGKAVFMGKVNFPDVYILHLEGKEERAALFVENAYIRITGKADSIQGIKISGSPVNDEYQAIKAVLDKENQAARAKYQEYQAAAQINDTVNAPRLMQEVKSLFDGIEKEIVNFVNNHPASWVTPVFLPQMQASMSIGGLDSLAGKLDPKLDVVPAVKLFKEHVEKLKKLEIGQIAPDFTQNDPDGKPVRLSDVYSKNKYTLVDFWAAWCGPCRNENPNVVNVYNDFKSRGFGVLGVSLDQDHDRWIKAIADDKLTWTHVSDLKYWENEAAALYAVNSIPANFLLDQTGKIVGRNLRGEDLRNKLKELLH